MFMQKRVIEFFAEKQIIFLFSLFDFFVHPSENILVRLLLGAAIAAWTARGALGRILTDGRFSEQHFFNFFIVRSSAIIEQRA